MTNVVFTSARNMFEENKFTWNTFLINMFEKTFSHHLFVSNTFHLLMHYVFIFTAPVRLKLFASGFWEILSQIFCFLSMADNWCYISSPAHTCTKNFVSSPYQFRQHSLLFRLFWLPSLPLSVAMFNLFSLIMIKTTSGSFDHDQTKQVSIMFRAMHCLVWTSFALKHVSFAFRLSCGCEHSIIH